ncbi:MAG: AAA family ATPase [Parachlamydiales bacterium]|nr:AAA family ATPase [Parachlamydiales bacterium]
MNKEIIIKRLDSLLNFTKQVAKLRSKTACNIEKNSIFYKLEHNITKLPGIYINETNDDSEHIWLRIKRLTAQSPPIPESSLLKVWLKNSDNPQKLPELHESIPFTELSKHNDLIKNDLEKETSIILLDSFKEKNNIKKLYQNYLIQIWKPWAEKEKLCRQTISLYSKLFSLKQQLEDGAIDSQIELVWGHGMAIWKMNNLNIKYPLITQNVELILDENSMDIFIRPCDISPNVELDIYLAENNSGATILEKKTKQFIINLPYDFSPFDPITYEELLKTIVTYLDSKGLYWPSQSTLKNRDLPVMSEELKVTDTWVILARHRNSNILVQDLENFSNQLKDKDLILPNSLLKLLTEPNDDEQIVSLSSLNNESASKNTKETQKIFFPLPYNDEQVRILDFLNKNSGVVVQGPPGTGKTHTIANIICHYLANGKRILVTSMKEAALSVLKKKLPEEIKSLVISLVSNESSELKQLEHSITKINSELQFIDRQKLKQEAENYNKQIIYCEANIASIDKKISHWASENLSSINLDDKTLTVFEAAKEVLSMNNEMEWFVDAISIDEKYNPLFTEKDIASIKKSRQIIGEKLHYLKNTLPKENQIPSTASVLELHSNLIQYAKLYESIKSNITLSLIDESEETQQNIQNLINQIKFLNETRREVESYPKEWIDSILKLIYKRKSDAIIKIFENLINNFSELCLIRNKFLENPVFIPDDFHTNTEFVETIIRLTKGEKPFGLKNLFGKRKLKDDIASVKIGNTIPQNESEWEHVYNYCNYILTIIDLLSKWNAITSEIELPKFNETSIEHFFVNVILKINEIYSFQIKNWVLELL